MSKTFNLSVILLSCHTNQTFGTLQTPQQNKLVSEFYQKLSWKLLGWKQHRPAPLKLQFSYSKLYYHSSFGFFFFFPIAKTQCCKFKKKLPLSEASSDCSHAQKYYKYTVETFTVFIFHKKVSATYAQQVYWYWSEKKYPPPHHKLVNWLILTGFVAERFVGFALCVTLVCKTVALSVNLMFKCVPLPDLHLQPRAPLHPLTVLNLKRSNKPKPQMTDHCSVKVISSE